MKKLVFILVFFWTIQSVGAQELTWQTDINKAIELSAKSKKPLMLFFTGSDWCGWCKKLTASVFSQPEFKTWADKNVVLLELDFPRRKTIPDHIKQQNASLQQAFQVSGYPTVWVFDLDKNEKDNNYSVGALGKTGYSPSVTEFTQGVDQMLVSRKK